MTTPSKAEKKLALIFDQCCYSDSLGVIGSDFSVCRWCGGGSSPGKSDFKHNEGCLFDDDALEKQVAGVWEEVPELEADLSRLQVELRDTKRALEHCANWYTDGNKPQEVIDYYMEKARKERECQ